MKSLLPPRRRLNSIDSSMAIVNIVLLLIFFFVLSGQDMKPEGELDLSETRRLSPDRLPSPILVIGGQGEWHLDGQPITPELLPVALAQAGTGAGLYLMIDRSAPASQLIATLNRPELDGLDIRLVTLHQEGTQ